MQYKLIRSKRKTLAMQVTRDAEVVVRAPMRTPLSEIEAFAAQHAWWAEKHLLKTKQALAHKEQFDFSDGQSMFLLGQPLRIQTAPQTQVCANSGMLLIPAGEQDRERAVTAFLKEMARKYLAQRTAYFAKIMNAAPASVTITSAKTRWGSCSGKGRVCFSYRLICLPPELVDYVVAHELAHLSQLNHSQRFYAAVAAVLPDYRTRIKAIKAFAKKLTL